MVGTVLHVLFGWKCVRVNRIEGVFILLKFH